MMNAKIKSVKQIFAISLFLALFTGALPVSGQENASNGAASRVLRFAAVFESMPGVDIEDVRLTLKLILKKSAALDPDSYTAEMDFIPDYSKSVDTILNGNYHFVIATGMDYSDLKRSIPLKPLIILTKLDQPGEPLVLVTRKGKSLDQIRRTPKTTLLLDEGRVGVMSRIWLDTILMEAGAAPSRSFFSEIRYSRKSSRILLPVFFGKADACVITRSTFDLMSDLNPQIGKTLTIQKQSEDLIYWLACATNLATPEDRRLFADRSAWLTNDPDVRQAITLVQMKQFFLFEEAYWEATAKLFERYQRLSNLKGKKGGEAAQ